MAESYQRLLETVKSELADVTGERDRVNQIVAAENNSREFQTWSASITEGIKDSCEKLADARLALGALSVNRARGLERFGSAAPAVLEEQIARFIHTQSNPVEILNFKLAVPFYRGDLRVMIYPMTKG